jgi:4-aminobutyrate aminotransferase/4-aminobutyrate aminotransferase/(S)-3-amino-2-methylpropionate transaminase
MTDALTQTNDALMARRAQALPRGVNQAHGVFAARAENAEIWDVEGRRWIDFCAGIAVLNTGHRHPRVMAAARAQLDRFTHTCFQTVAYESYVRLAERLNVLAPGTTPKKTFFMNTGAEAVENAVKVARAHTGRSGVIAFNGAFHGRTMMTLALTGKVDPYKKGFGPFPGEVYHAPYPDPLHGVTADDALHGIELIFKNDIDPGRVAAIIIEPVQGEGGYIPAPAEFLRRLRALCDKHGIVLIVDEIQTGVARCGKFFAIEHAGVEPDVITLAKGLGGGMTLSAILGKSEVMDAAVPGGLGSTYAGHPVAIAAALAVLDVIEEEKLAERAAHIGEICRARLNALRARHACIADVRGLGAMSAVEFCHGGDPKKPAGEIASALKEEAARRGLLLLTCGGYGNVLRLMLPLTIPDAVLDEGFGILEAALDGIGLTHPPAVVK